MIKHLNKIFFLVTLFASMYLISATPAKADSYFTAWFDIINDPTYGQHMAQYAPSTLKLIFFSYAYGDTGDTKVKIDCNSDGIYEIDRTIPISPTYAYDGRGSDYWTMGGDYWRYNKVYTSDGKPAYWASIRDNSINCFYALPGNYTINMVAERSGVQATLSRSFYLREPTVDVQVRPFYSNNIIFPTTGGYGSVMPGVVPKIPADIDFGVAIYNPITNSPLFTSSATLKFDCDSDGTEEKTAGYSTSSNVYHFGREWELWCTSGGYFNVNSISACYNSISASLNWYPKACHYDKPGIYRATVKAELPTGGASPYVRESSVEFPVLSTQSPIVNFSTGGDPTYGNGILRGVDLKLDTSSLVWTSASYNFSCGNGQSASHSIAVDYSKRNYNQDYSYTAKDLCNYDSPGDYTAKVQIEFTTMNLPGGIRNTLPFSEVRRTNNYITYSLEKTIRIVVVGNVSDTEYVVTTPFNLRWDVSRVTSCSVVGVGNNFSVASSGSKTVGVASVSPGDYTYKLSCTSSSGVTVDKTIKVKVIAL